MYGLVQFCEVLTAFSSSNELLLQKTASSSSLQFQQFLRSSLQFPAVSRSSAVSCSSCEVSLSGWGGGLRPVSIVVCSD